MFNEAGIETIETERVALVHLDRDPAGVATVLMSHENVFIAVTCQY